MTRPREAARARAISERGIRRARLAGAALLILGLGALRAKPSIRVLGVKRQARDAYLLYLKRRLARFLRMMEAQRRRKNARIDTPESYRAIGDECGNW